MADDTARKNSKYQPARWIGKPNIHKIQLGLLAVLHREVKRLLDESHKAKLSADSSRDLVKYLNLVKEMTSSKPGKPLKESDQDEIPDDPFEDLDDTALAKLAKKSKPGGQDV